MSKRRWESKEDEILAKHVQKYGVGNWSCSGIERSERSCRDRWQRYLRPDLKKDNWSPDEEKIVSDLHFRFGDKWSQIASQLPGRVGNDVRMYWIRRVRKRAAEGLPIYGDYPLPMVSEWENPPSPSLSFLHPIDLPFEDPLLSFYSLDLPSNQITKNLEFDNIETIVLP